MSGNMPVATVNRRAAGTFARKRIRLLAPRLVLLVLLPLFAAGCFQHEVVVRVNGDGSGVIIERVVMSHEAVEMFAQMAPRGKPFQLRSVEKLREDAANYGESVRLHSGKNVETEFGRGYEAKYVFEDVSKLRIGQNPGDRMPGSEGAGNAGDAEAQQFTTFSLRRGEPAELMIHWPVNENGTSVGEDSAPAAVDNGANPVAPESEEEQAALEMMAAAFKGMRMAVHIEVAGEILESNATHRQDNRVTLVDIAFGELLSSEDALLQMAGQKPQSVADLKQLMTHIPGLKLEIEPEVAIRFQ